MSHPNPLETLFHGPNAGYVLDRYDRYLADPAFVDPESRALFDRWQSDDTVPVNGSGPVAAATPSASSGQI